MKAIHTLALIAAAAVLNSSTPLSGSEPDGRVELSSDKPTAFQTHLRYDLIESREKTSAPTNEQPDLRFEDEIGDLLAPQGKPEAGTQPGGYRLRIELRAAKPNNVVQSKVHPGIEYSGILVQSLRNHPLQLFNLLAPAQ
jgi:hypothetical protein